MAFHDPIKAVEHLIETIEEQVGLRQKKPVEKKKYGKKTPFFIPPDDEQSYDRFLRSAVELQKQTNNKEQETEHLEPIKKQIDITNKDKSIDNALKLIQQFDEYMNYMYGTHCPLHTIQEIEIADSKV